MPCRPSALALLFSLVALCGLCAAVEQGASVGVHPPTSLRGAEAQGAEAPKEMALGGAPGEQKPFGRGDRVGRSASERSRDPLVSGLSARLQELRERKENILQLEKTMGSTEALIKEGVRMRSVASSKRARQTYEHQIEDSERMHKETAAMLLMSREEAKQEARDLLGEMGELRALDAAISSEASSLVSRADASARGARGAGAAPGLGKASGADQASEAQDSDEGQDEEEDDDKGGDDNEQ